jgi:uncharacterized protein (DUF58 family)
MAQRFANLAELLGREFLARLDGLDVLTRRILQGRLQGERRSKRRGQSVEFAEHRPYALGDDMRFVDWNTYARLDQLFLKLFLEEQDLTVHVLLDVSASTELGEPSKSLAMLRLAAALSYVALVNNNRLTLSTFADGLIGQATNLRGRVSLRRLSAFLLEIESPDVSGSDFEKSCRELEAGRIGSGVTIVISDFLFKEGYETGLKRLSDPRYDLFVLQVLSPQEIAPELTGDLRLLDVEDADVAEVTISRALLEYYKRNVSAYCNEIRDFCTRRGAGYVLARSDEPAQQLVLNSLRRKGLLR